MKLLPARRAWGVLLAALLAAGSASAQPANTTEAQQITLFRRGRLLMDDHHYAEALQVFQASQELLPSPNTELYMARCLREMGKLDEAYNTFLSTSTDAHARSAAEPRFAPTADAAD